MQQISRALKRDLTPGLSQRNIFGGYGMGLRLFDDTRLGYLVSHSGGLPGYGSNMIWHPERQLALISLANITYAPMFDANFVAPRKPAERRRVYQRRASIQRCRCKNMQKHLSLC